MIILIVTVLAILSAILYAMVGWGIAWVVDLALPNTDVNYTVFVIVMMVIWAIKILILHLQFTLYRRAKKKIEKEFGFYD